MVIEAAKKAAAVTINRSDVEICRVRRSCDWPGPCLRVRAHGKKNYLNNNQISSVMWKKNLSGVIKTNMCFKIAFCLFTELLIGLK